MWKNSTIIKLENFCIELRKSIIKEIEINFEAIPQCKNTIMQPIEENKY